MTKEKKVLLVGLGEMGIDYAKVLKSLGQETINVGRSINSVEEFKKATGLDAIAGGIENYLIDNDNKIESAIVAVTEDEISHCLDLLIEFGINRILVEKPGGSDYQSIKHSAALASKNNVDVIVGYNRRFYESVRHAREIIKDDDGVSSFFFEFTEWSDTISKLDTSDNTKKLWFLHNSTHVVDMAFFLCGYPEEIICMQDGDLAWHPSGSSFSGTGKTQTGALFTYLANWDAPGRWGLEVLTKKRRLIFRPLEKLQCQLRGSVAIDHIEINDRYDIDHKPGLFLQVQSFLEENDKRFLRLSDQVEHLKLYQMICPE